MNKNGTFTSSLTAIVTCLLLTSSGAVLAQGNKGAMNGQPFQSLQDQINEANATLDELEALSPTLEELLADVEVLELTIAALGEEIDALGIDAEENSETIASLFEEIATLDGELVSKQDILDGACDEGSTLRAIYSDGSFLCEVNGGSSASIVTTVLVSSYLTMPRGTSPRVLEASCPSGYQVTGGGYEASNINYRTEFNVLRNVPLDDTTWHLTMVNNSSPNGTERVRIRMVCVR